MITRTYAGIAPEGFKKLQAGVQSKLGIPIQGDTGEAAQDGFRVHWNYDAAKETVTLVFDKKPFYVTEGMIDSALKQIIG